MPSDRPAFASDNYAGVHPDVMHAVVAANDGHVPSYGADPTSAKAQAVFREHFGEDIDMLFTFNGTGANIVGLSTMVRPFETIICAETAHINVDECGAPERFLGSKVTDVPTSDGKLTVESVEAASVGTGDPHHVQPRVLSITQSTELGTLYTPDEIANLADWAHQRDMLVHLDGARLSNAAASLGCELGDLGAPLGVDVMSFGATKNGGMGAEAVIFFRRDLAAASPYIHKQSMQLGSKMRFLSAQFVALLETDLWRTNATHANAMAQRLASGVEKIPGVEISYPVQANAVFAVLPQRTVTDALQAEYPFYYWDESRGQVRWMTSFDTSETGVDTFVHRLAELARAAA